MAPFAFKQTVMISEMSASTIPVGWNEKEKLLEASLPHESIG
jgi:hypothetical protein